MKTYKAYKDSGVEWIGKIPKQWVIVKLKWLANIYSGGTPSTNIDSYWTNGTIPWLNSGTVNQKRITNSSSFITEDALANSSAKWVNKGSILMALAGQGKTKGMAAMLEFDATCNQSMAAIDINNEETLNEFILFWLEANYLNIRSMGGGDKRDGINLQILGNIKCTFPSFEEQIIIANYLNNKTAIIDSLIDKKEQLIQKLQAQRQAIINEAVTKGSNPNAKMKDSGVEWLGEIPEHWEVVKLKFLTNKIIDGAHFTPTYVEKGVPFLRVTDIQTKEIDLLNVKFIPENEHNELIKRCNPEKGDILLSKNGTIGITKVIDWDWEFSVFVSLCLIKFNERLLSRYFSHFFNSSIVDQQIKLGSKTTSVTNLHLDKIRELLIAIPKNTEEQEVLCDYLDYELMKFDEVINKTKIQIKKLKLYRQSIISEAVTGKIDVRDWQPKTKQNA